MKKLLLIALFPILAAPAFSQCTAVTLTEVGFVDGAYMFDFTKPTLSDGCVPWAFEWCYQNPGGTPVVVPAAFLPGNSPTGVTPTSLSWTWYHGIVDGAQIWFNTYCVPSVPKCQYITGTYFAAAYEQIKVDRSKWVKSNVLIVKFGSTSPGKGKKK